MKDLMDEDESLREGARTARREYDAGRVTYNEYRAFCTNARSLRRENHVEWMDLAFPDRPRATGADLTAYEDVEVVVEVVEADSRHTPSSPPIYDLFPLDVPSG